MLKYMIRFSSKVNIFLLLISLFYYSCDESSHLGLEVQPSSDKIEIFNASLNQNSSNPSFLLTTESVDSLRSDEPSSLLLGKISQPYDPIFGDNTGSFITQISLSESNIDLGNNPIVDSVVMSYSYSGYYGDLSSPVQIAINYVDLNIYKDSVYYSNQQFFNPSNISEDLMLDFTISTDTSVSPKLKMTLENSIGQQILDIGNSGLIDNETFQENFGCFFLNEYSLIGNTIIYLNPSGSNSEFKIYYHNDDSDSLHLDFVLDGESARINLFNEKPITNLLIDGSKSFVQSMAGFQTKIELQNINLIDSLLMNKAINKVTLSFNVTDDSEYISHENLSLVRVDSSGNNVFLKDLSVEGATHFGGELESSSYEFNITRFFSSYLNDESYTDELYILASGGVINANRTVIDNNSFLITILYSDL